MSTTVWLVTIGVLSLVLLIDLVIAIIQRNKETSFKTALGWTIFYLALAIGFGWSMGHWNSLQARTEFFAGWITEYSLSVDNLFVFLLILSRLKVRKEREQLVLLAGIVTSLVLRGIFILLGASLINRFSWIFFIFGGFLIYTAVGLLRESKEEEWKEGRLILWLRRRGSSPFLIAFAALALTDLLFALDSIPAIFGLTTDPYIVFTANIFALMGLRQLYFLLGGLMERLVFLTQGLAIILFFIGIKLIFEAAESQGWHKIFGVHVPVITLSESLMVILTTLAVTTILSLMRDRREKRRDA